MSKDTIYREDAIKALRKLGHEVVVIDKVCSLGVAQEFIDAIRAIPSADRPQGWIPCSEKLPEDPNPSFTYASKTYQVTTASGEVVALKWHKTELRGKTVMRWERSSGVIYHGDALAWKPLSEPWEGADDESKNHR